MAIQVTTATGTESVLQNAVLNDFAAGLRGRVLTEADDEYNDVRQIYNGMIDKRPAIVVRCKGTADVIDAVNLARDRNLLIAVRGGGHGVAGNAVCDGGIMIDLSLMRAVQVDPAGRTARVQGGAKLGDVDHETQAFGLVAPAGVVSDTGVAGLTLGGGFGWVRAKHGLTIDNLLSVNIVTADGQFRRASATENTDLFWAVRGGGGNFGIVTEFEFQLHELGPMVMFCAPMYAAEHAGEVLRAWRDFMRVSPDDFTTEFFFWTIPPHPDFPAELHGTPVVVPAGVYAGRVDVGEEFVQPLREVTTPILDLSGPKQFAEVQRMFDPYVPKGMLSYWKSLYLDRLDEEVMHTLIDVFEGRPAVRTPFVLQDLRGASCRVAADATAFGERTMPYMFEFNSSWDDPAETDRNVAWTREIWSDMRRRFSSGGNYLNMTCYNEDGESLVEGTFGKNYARLREIKKKYDPLNLFHLNANIIPAN